MGNQVEWNVINKEPPDEVTDVLDMLLVRFWSKNGLEQPTPIVNLPDMPNLFEGGNGLTHNWLLLWSILDLLHSDWGGVTGINHTLVILNGYPHPVLVKHVPVLLHEVGNHELNGRIKVR